MGAMTSPGQAHLLALEAPNLLVAAYPLVMVPTSAVPLALMLHGLLLAAAARDRPDRSAGGGLTRLASHQHWGGRPGYRLLQ
jgi:hypothetical protein